MKTFSNIKGETNFHNLLRSVLEPYPAITVSKIKSFTHDISQTNSELMAGFNAASVTETNKSFDADISCLEQTIDLAAKEVMRSLVTTTQQLGNQKKLLERVCHMATMTRKAPLSKLRADAIENAKKNNKKFKTDFKRIPVPTGKFVP